MNDIDLGDFDIDPELLAMLEPAVELRPLKYMRKMFRIEDEFQEFHRRIENISSEKDRRLAFLDVRFARSGNVVFKNKTFMFTETFLFGSRKECAALAEQRGGIFKNSKKPTLDLDYLVLGEKDPVWKEGVFFGKIEHGFELIEQGHRLQFVSETDFLSAVGSIK